MVKRFSTVRDTKRGSQSYMEKKRERRPSSTHQNTNSSFPNQETLTSYLFNPTHREEPPQ